jgi:uncharacterized protein (DUF697 family)/tellurite resistance protein
MTTIQPQTLTGQEHHAVICICILAAFSDGGQSESERSQIERIVNGFSAEHPDLSAAYQDALQGKLSLPELADELKSPAARALAYEMAVCVCNADGVLQASESQFLSELRQALHIDSDSPDNHQQAAQALVAQPFLATPPPVIDANRDAEVDRMILNAAILNGALEIMPHTMATMAIVPLQMRMVYRVGASYGYNLDSGHIKDFVATVGVGLGSQVLEGYAERLIGGFARHLGGRLLGGLATQAIGSGVAFASTYALGQVAKRYYASGRTLSAGQLKEVFATMLSEAKAKQVNYSGDIAARARQTNILDLMPIVRQGI